MFSANDHVVRSIFTSLGLYGPMTEAQRQYSASSAADDYDKSRRLDTATIDFRDKTIRLGMGGMAFFVNSHSSFENLDEAYELALLMASQVPNENRVFPFLQLQRSYLGRMFVLSDTFSVGFYHDKGLGHEVVFDETRRNNLLIHEVRVGREFSWRLFSEDFNGYRG